MDKADRDFLQANKQMHSERREKNEVIDLFLKITARGSGYKSKAGSMTPKASVSILGRSSVGSFHFGQTIKRPTMAAQAGIHSMTEPGFEDGEEDVVDLIKLKEYIKGYEQKHLIQTDQALKTEAYYCTGGSINKVRGTLTISENLIFFEPCKNIMAG